MAVLSELHTLVPSIETDDERHDRTGHPHQLHLATLGGLLTR
jgi:hypothetical protein